jgi:hypothetical protein
MNTLSICEMFKVYFFVKFKVYVNYFFPTTVYYTLIYIFSNN